MIPIEEHSKKFEEIRNKYNLSNPDKAEEIARFLTTHRDNNQSETKISAKEFAKLFSMDEEDAFIFLSFIERGLNFKKKHIDNN